MNPQEVALFHSLRGAAAVLLLIFMRYPQQAIQNKQLAVISGYSGKTLSTALATLEALGFTRRTSRGWQLHDGSEQLALWRETENFRLDAPSSSNRNTLLPAMQEEEKEPTSPSRKISAYWETLDQEQRLQWIMLSSAGVGRYSPKMKEILERRISTALIEEHYEVRKKVPERYPTGHMITKLLNHEPPPSRLDLYEYAHR